MRLCGGNITGGSIIRKRRVDVVNGNSAAKSRRMRA